MASLPGAPIDATTAKPDARELSVTSGGAWPSRDCRPSGLAAPKLPFANYGTRPLCAIHQCPQWGSKFAISSRLGNGFAQFVGCPRKCVAHLLLPDGR